LASQAGERALQNAGWQAERIDAVIVSPCTGYLCPGLTSYVSEGMGLRPDVLALDLVGQGCSAALPNLRTGEALLASGRCRSVLSICVEVCSAAIYLDDDPATFELRGDELDMAVTEVTTHLVAAVEILESGRIAPR